MRWLIKFSFDVSAFSWTSHLALLFSPFFIKMRFKLCLFSFFLNISICTTRKYNHSDLLFSRQLLQVIVDGRDNNKRKTNQLLHYQHTLNDLKFYRERKEYIDFDWMFDQDRCVFSNFIFKYICTKHSIYTLNVCYSFVLFTSGWKVW